MKIFSALVCVLFFSGCCSNQSDPDGYSIGLDCYTPIKTKDKSCKVDDPNKSCDEKSQKT